MSSEWKDIPINSKLFQNVPETILTNSNAALENCYQAENGAHIRFPGLKDFTALAGVAPVYLHEWKGDLVAVTNGNVYRVDQSGTATNVTDVPVSGGNYPTFSRTEDELLMAAGGPIIRLAGEETEILSKDAPDSTHVGYVDGYVVAVEPHSGRFYHASAGTPRVWDPLDVFAAESKPDDVNALAVTPRRELLICGLDSIEQYERLPSGTTPFFRRWAVGEGVFAPYTMVTADNGAWVVNKEKEFVRFAGQVSEVTSDYINLSLEGIDDWTGAWASLFHTQGQKFIILQMPKATNSYGSKGVTCIFDYRQHRWFNLFGWDDDTGLPARWPGWSYYRMWGREFVGGNGKILEIDANTFTNDGQVQRMLGRTGHIDKWGESRVDNLRIRILRGGAGPNDAEPVISIRAIRDNGKPTRWKSKGLGKAGDRTMNIEFGGFGCAHAWQFEYFVTDACHVELVSMQAQLTRVG